MILEDVDAAPPDVVRSLTITNTMFLQGTVSGWGYPQGDLHMVAVVAVYRNALVGTGWSNSCLVCTNRLRKHCSHLVECSFLAVKAFSALNRCLLAENAD